MRILNTRARTAFVMAIVVGVALAGLVVGAGSDTASTVPPPVITSALTQFDSNAAAKTARAQCPAGTRVIGGGGRVNGGQHVPITRQQPVHGTVDTFEVSAIEDQTGTTQSWSVQAYAICSVPLPGLEIVSATSAAGSGAFSGPNRELCGPR